MRSLLIVLTTSLLIQAQTPTDRWRHTATGDQVSCVGGDLGRLFVFEPDTGAGLWSADLAAAIVELACQDAVVLARLAENQLVCLNAQNGAVLWKRDSVGALWTSPLLVRSPDGRELACLDPGTGEPLWQFEGSWLAAVHVQEDRVLIQDLERLSCLEISGRLLWQVDGDFDGRGFLTDGCFGLARNEGDKDVRLELRSLSDGQIRWSKMIAACSISMSPGPLFAADSQRLFAYLPAPRSANRLFAFELVTGQELWKLEGEVSALLPREQGLFVLHDRLGACRLEPARGEVVWNTPLSYARACGLAMPGARLLLWDGWNSELRIYRPDGTHESSRTLTKDGVFAQQGSGAQMLYTDRLLNIDPAGAVRWSQDVRALDPQTARGLAAEKRLAEGLARFEDRAFQAAIEVWLRLADEFPGSPSHPLALFNIGLAHEELADFEAAIEVYTRLLDCEIDPLEPGQNLMQAYRNTRHRACLRLAHCSEQRGDLPSALRWARAARDEHPYLSWCGTCAIEADQELDALIARLEEALVP